MSSNIKETTSGTQSPPLEATGSEKPMGVCSIDGTKPTYALDREQRKEYFSHLDDSEPEDCNMTEAKIPGQSVIEEKEKD